MGCDSVSSPLLWAAAEQQEGGEEGENLSTASSSVMPRGSDVFTGSTAFTSLFKIEMLLKKLQHLI